METFTSPELACRKPTRSWSAVARHAVAITKHRQHPSPVPRSTVRSSLAGRRTASTSTKRASAVPRVRLFAGRTRSSSWPSATSKVNCTGKVRRCTRRRNRATAATARRASTTARWWATRTARKSTVELNCAARNDWPVDAFRCTLETTDAVRFRGDARRTRTP
uniref:(northern house mosquito) hypothetical protein n=1 Tax=Culex pipiens TaxID=7175 RepID=A0A8D8FPC4_CULPI